MAAARVMGTLPGLGLRMYSTLLLVILGALFSNCAGRFALASFSPSLFAEDVNQIAWPADLAFSDGGLRHLLQIIDGNTTTTTKEPLKLATSRTDRPDPLDSLHKYRGGYNLSSKHYGASVGYTGLPAWILAVLWAALGLILLLTLCFTCCCCRHRTRHEFSHGRLGYVLPIVALTLFTLAAIAGSILLYYSQQKFNRELRDTLNYVVNQSETTEARLREVQSNLTSIANIKILNQPLPLSNVDRNEITSLTVQLNNTANDLRDKTVDNRENIRDAINVVQIVLIVVAAVMLGLVLLGLLFSSLGVRSLVYILVLLGWVLVFATWILCAIFILLDNGIGDTCLSMKEWVDNPEANTSLDKFLPCNGAAAAAVLSNSATYTSSIEGAINNTLAVVVNRNFPPNRNNSLWYNQTGPLVPSLCSSSPCPNNTVTSAQAPSEWLKYECVADSSGICVTQGRFTPEYYREFSSAAEAANSLSSSVVFLANAANCGFVRDVFTDIHDNRCHNLRLHTSWIWIGLVLVSAGNMFSILLWIVFIRRKRYRFCKSKQERMPMYKGQSQPYSPTPAQNAVSPAA